MSLGEPKFILVVNLEDEHDETLKNADVYQDFDPKIDLIIVLLNNLEVDYFSNVVQIIFGVFVI